MEVDVFLLLLAFTVAKIGLAGAIVWIGVRSPERPAESDEPDRGGGGAPNRPPSANGGRRAHERGRPDRSPERMGRRRARRVPA